MSGVSLTHYRSPIFLDTVKVPEQNFAKPSGALTSVARFAMSLTNTDKRPPAGTLLPPAAFLFMTLVNGYVAVSFNDGASNDDPPLLVPIVVVGSPLIAVGPAAVLLGLAGR